MPHLPLSFEAPIAGIVAASLAVVACGVALLRRVDLPRHSSVLAMAALVCFALAAGKLTWNAAPPLRIAVMIDASASMRTAEFHDPALLEKRLQQLIPSASYKLYAFADQTIPTELELAYREIATRQTQFDPPPCDAIALFSDGRFEPPTSLPPTFVVVDPALEHVNDAAVAQLDVRERTASVTINNSADAARSVHLSNATPTTLPAPPGNTVMTADVAPAATDVSATLARGDPWPENDSLTAFVPPPAKLERWWITSSDRAAAAPPGWRVIAPADLPSDGAPYLRAGVIALANVAIDDLPGIAQARLDQHVRASGGGLLILGGDRAFAAGGYAGSLIEALSPLASDPPSPATRWVLLIDSSGSMSAALGDNTRLHFAIDAAMRLLRLLPASDSVTAGDFARDVRWWVTSTAVSKLDFEHLVPRDLRPNGPTNLQPALQSLASTSDSATPTQVLIITDAEAHIDDPAILGAALADKRIRVSMLSTEKLSPAGLCKRLIDATGGVNLAERDPRQWANTLKQLLRAAAPRRLNTSPLHVAFKAGGPRITDQTATPWNTTWLKQSATELASGRDGAATVPAVAAWNIGTGAALSAAFMPAASVAEQLAEVVAAPPRDPRFTVTWETGSNPHVTLDARENGRFMNDLHPRLSLVRDRSLLDVARPLVQTAPGRYELAFGSSTRASLARLLLEDKVIDRIAVPGRYLPEFDAVGNDRAALRLLAERSGGRVIEPSDTQPIIFPKHVSSGRSLVTPLAVAGAVLLCAALVLWKLR